MKQAVTLVCSLKFTFRCGNNFLLWLLDCTASIDKMRSRIQKWRTIKQ